MAKPLYLCVNGKLKDSRDITYNDLIILTREYINKGNRLNSRSFKSSNNLPCGDRVRKILNQQNMSLFDFMEMFSTYDNMHTHFDVNEYNEYVDRYIHLSKENKKPISCRFLKKYNLPNRNWFIKYCPDKSVKKWNDFLKWCGLNIIKTNKSSDISKELIICKLSEYEELIGRPIKCHEVRTSILGFSRHVISFYWKNFYECKKEIGLLENKRNTYKPWEYYNITMQEILREVSHKMNSNSFAWEDILRYKTIPLSKTCFINACNRNNIDVEKYFNDLGYNILHQKGKGVVTKLDNGELCLSNLEYKFSLFLRQNSISYKRDVRYGTIDEEYRNRKYNCDYVITGKYWIEICGIIKSSNKNWKQYKCKNNIEQEYKDKLLIKESILIKNNIPFLFLFQEDFDKNTFQEKIINLIK